MDFFLKIFNNLIKRIYFGFETSIILITPYEEPSKSKLSQFVIDAQCILAFVL